MGQFHTSEWTDKAHSISRASAASVGSIPAVLRVNPMSLKVKPLGYNHSKPNPSALVLVLMAICCLFAWSHWLVWPAFSVDLIATWDAKHWDCWLSVSSKVKEGDITPVIDKIENCMSPLFSGSSWCKACCRYWNHLF